MGFTRGAAWAEGTDKSLSSGLRIDFSSRDAPTWQDKPILFRMTPHKVRIIAVVAFLLGLSVTSLSAQSFKIVNLKPPAYPPIALAARVSGEVDLKITLLSDGTPEGVQIESGRPMLRQAAVDSATGSKFEFNGTSQPGTVYSLRYIYVLKPLECDQALNAFYPLIQQDADTVTVIGQAVPLCDPGAEIHVRSIKCLYQWKCSIK